MSHVSTSKIISCAACKKSVRSTQQLKCAKCASYYHAICVNVIDVRGLSEEVRSTWECPLCKSKLPKSDNSNTPVRAAVPVELCVTTAVSGTASKLNTPLCSPLATPDPDALESLALEMRLMREDMGDLKTQIKFLSEHITTKLDECTAKCHQLEKRDKARETELCSLKCVVTELRDQLNGRAQATLRNEIEVSGLPETREESPMHLVRVAASKIGVSLEDTDIDYVTRVGSRGSKNGAGSDQSSSKFPRPLVVRFVRRHKRDEFLRAAKSRRNLVSADLEVDGPSTKLYFNERLTYENRLLFRTARQRSGEAGYKYCWTKYGNIHIRRREGAPAIVIKSPDDLERHFVPGSTPMEPPPN